MRRLVWVIKSVLPREYQRLSIHSKPIDEITYQDISDFCDSKTPECYFVDYKLQTPSDIAKDVAAMANAVGGVILIGIRTIGEAEGKPGIPDELVGIPDGQKELRRIDKKCGDTLYPPLIAESASCELPHSPGNFVLLLRVPASQSAPHWLGEGDDNKIPIRVSDFTTIRRFTRLIRPSELDGVMQRRQKLAAHREGLRERAIERSSLRAELIESRRHFGLASARDAKFIADQRTMGLVEVSISPVFPSATFVERENLLRLTREISNYFNEPRLRGTAHETGWFRADNTYCECTAWGTVFLARKMCPYIDSTDLPLYTCFTSLGEALTFAEVVMHLSNRLDLMSITITVARANKNMNFYAGGTASTGKIFDYQFELSAECLSTELFSSARVESLVSEILFASGLGLDTYVDDLKLAGVKNIGEIRRDIKLQIGKT